VIAVTLAMAGIFVYVWIRYAWQFGMNALLAMIHDVVTTIGLFSLFGLQFDLATVAAVLTVAGYSVNDKVVVFDRIRFEMRRYKTMPMSDVVNLSVNETLSRTTVTAGLTFISVLALYLFGGAVLHGFALALMWGIFIGTYSSICIAAAGLLNLRHSRIRGDDAGAKEAGKGRHQRMVSRTSREGKTWMSRRSSPRSKQIIEAWRGRVPHLRPASRVR
jgi:preprotein translocase subunit SecF